MCCNCCIPIGTPYLFFNENVEFIFNTYLYCHQTSLFQTNTALMAVETIHNCNIRL